MLARGGSPTLWHAMWRQLGRLNDNEPFVMLHGALCGILETGLCYDQINAPALASFELICRQIQIAEEKYKDKFSNIGGDSSFDYHLMAGTTHRSQLCICPALTEWLAEELRKQTAVDKERRKARDERLLQKPDKPPKKGE